MSDVEIERYAEENLLQEMAEHDTFTIERYRQIASHLQSGTRNVLDVGCSTGRGGAEIMRLWPDVELWGIDVVQQRLDQLPAEYSRRVLGLSTDIPLADRSVDAVIAAEFLEHLQARDVDATLCEFQRVLRIGGMLILTTPNPNSLRLLVRNMTVYTPGHLTQHHCSILKHRVKMHGFRNVRIQGTGKMTRHIGTMVPFLPLYGSYLLRAEKR